jgi:hypothetical protein
VGSRSSVFLALLGLAAAALVVGWLIRRWWIVPALAAAGAVVVVIDVTTGDAENQLLVAVVQLVCTGIIAGSGGVGCFVGRHRASRQPAS